MALQMIGMDDEGQYVNMDCMVNDERSAFASLPSDPRLEVIPAGGRKR